MPIRQLSPIEINRIAAGEVIERPASAVKELIENAIDAGARVIEIIAEGGGLSFLRVADDGCGMDEHDLRLCVERHATSKLPRSGSLLDVATLGFRGEALPSLGAVGKLIITTRARGAGHGLKITVTRGQKSEVAPCPAREGTTVELSDLFAATPARLKFMKSERAENGAITDAVRRLALAAPAVGFKLTCGERASLDLEPVRPADEEALRLRFARVMGKDFATEAERVAFEREGITIEGFAGRPTLNRPDAALQYLFVNNRPVKDRLILSAIRAAYADLIPRGRHPVVALFVRVPLADVDVNVHPAKAEVRFRQAALVRSVVIAALNEALGRGAGRTTSALARRLGLQGASFEGAARGEQPSYAMGFAPAPVPSFQESPQQPLDYGSESEDAPAGGLKQSAKDGHLGHAKAQIGNAFIVSETANGLALIDQHAAHERIVYEKLKRGVATGGIVRQILLIPEIVELDDAEVALLLEHQDLLEKGGLVIEPFGPGAVAVREVASLIAEANLKGLVKDLVSELEDGSAKTIEEALNRVLATMACHHSIRSGRPLHAAEMNALLREMERTPNAGQCNHGRPTFVELSWSDVKRLFER